MFRIAVLLFIGICISTKCYCQPTEKQIQLVLAKNVQDSLFVFDTSVKISEKLTDYNVVNLTYLGSVTTNKGITYKIVTSKWIWNISQRGTSRIYIYNSKNLYVGQYHVGMTYDLPSKMANGVLLFDIDTWESCDKGTRLCLNLKNGLPRQFFLPCKGESGNLYYFSSGD